VFNKTINLLAKTKECGVPLLSSAYAHKYLCLRHPSAAKASASAAAKPSVLHQFAVAKASASSSPPARRTDHELQTELPQSSLPQPPSARAEDTAPCGLNYPTLAPHQSDGTSRPMRQAFQCCTSKLRAGQMHE
jgi:hypothetical protein